jgi:hypothetical protein
MIGINSNESIVDGGAARPGKRGPGAGRRLRQRRANTGFHRDIAAGSRWQLAGRIAQGDVYQAVGNVFTVEGAHIHEAYLVVDNQAVVGFYLPAERGFSPLKQHSAISLQ